MDLEGVFSNSASTASTVAARSDLPAPSSASNITCFPCQSGSPYGDLLLETASNGDTGGLSRLLKRLTAGDAPLQGDPRHPLSALMERPHTAEEQRNPRAARQREAQVSRCTRQVAAFSGMLLTPNVLGDIMAGDAFNFAMALHRQAPPNIAIRREVVLATFASQLDDGQTNLFRPDYNRIFCEVATPAQRERVALLCMRLHRDIGATLKAGAADPWADNLARRMRETAPDTYAYWSNPAPLVKPQDYMQPTQRFRYCLERGEPSGQARLTNRCALGLRKKDLS